MMQKFVSIQTFFLNSEDRVVDKLTQLYEDIELLERNILNLLTNRIDLTSISGKRVLLKPNWVKHSSSPDDEVCLRTHDHFLLAVLSAIIKQKPAQIVIGDAPIQGCQWNKMLSVSFVSQVKVISEKYNVPVYIKDFRRVTFDPDNNVLQNERSGLDEFLIFNLGKESYLEEITVPGKNLFRVSQYNPDRFTESHSPGVHKYCITKELFESDIVFSLPKIKTHQKAGITAALKNIVGLNGDKDFLPHHRIGGTAFGGDSYPGNNYLRYISELFLDNANRKKGKSSYQIWLKLSSLFWKLSLPKQLHQPSAAWYGNDTTWRMVMDLNKIVFYGRPDGTLADTEQRQFYSLSDGIIGGQGDGPLKPKPLHLGIIMFSNTSSWNDICAATIMGLDPNKIPLLISAKKFERGKDVDIFLNGQTVNSGELETLAIATILPPGWVGYENSHLIKK
jgi:uncharacterized protein (DUF362 family)